MLPTEKVCYNELVTSKPFNIRFIELSEDHKFGGNQC